MKHINWVVPTIFTMFFYSGDLAAERLVYITKTQHQGDTALTACAEGYHFASFTEIYDIGNLVYNTELGKTSDDSGSGIPAYNGWVRSGTETRFQSTSPACSVWTSADENVTGTNAFLNLYQLNPISETQEIDHQPWVLGHYLGCDINLYVWCIQDYVKPCIIHSDGFEACTK